MELTSVASPDERHSSMPFCPLKTSSRRDSAGAWIESPLLPFPLERSIPIISYRRVLGKRSVSLGLRRRGAIPFRSLRDTQELGGEHTHVIVFRSHDISIVDEEDGGHELAFAGLIGPPQ